MGRAKKVVLAYSGGVDTSVCIPYLKQEWGVEDVITFAADLGHTSVFTSLGHGGSLHVLPEEVLLDGNGMARYFDRHEVDWLSLLVEVLDDRVDRSMHGIVEAVGCEQQSDVDRFFFI